LTIPLAEESPATPIAFHEAGTISASGAGFVLFVRRSHCGHGGTLAHDHDNGMKEQQLDKLSARLSESDAANLVAIANAMRTDRQPFVTRSAALKLALKVVAEEPHRFVEEGRGGPEGATEGAE
jgi:hypothetical protein